jgi:lipopolysaccharide transport system permease protein
MVTLLKELFTYRGLIHCLVVRDLKARYRGSVLGFLWTFLNPALLMGTYTLVFAVYRRLEMDRYAAFLIAGLLPWLWFSSSVVTGSTSVVQGGEFLKKVFMPPQVLPAVSVLANLINFLLSLPLLFGFLVLLGIRPGWTIIALIPVMTIQLVFTYGFTLMVSAVTVRYRDVTQLLTNFLTFWFFLSPVVYPPSEVPATFQALLMMNPMAPLLIGYQRVLLQNAWPEWPSLAVSSLLATGVIIGGGLVFERFRWTFAEEL